MIEDALGLLFLIEFEDFFNALQTFLNFFLTSRIAGISLTFESFARNIN